MVVRKFALRLWLLFFMVCSIGGSVAAPNSTDAMPRWVHVRDTDPQIAAGSLLDFSGWAGDRPDGRYSWAVARDGGGIGFAKRHRRQRFFAASFAFSPPSGGFPQKEGADRIVEQLQRTGYNAVRLQHVDAELMTRRDKNLDYDPVQLDRFDCLLSRFKAAGIYVVMDAAYGDNGAYGGVYPNDQDCHLPDRRQARLRGVQPSCLEPT